MLINLRHRVAMLVIGLPQFQTQDDFGLGDGINPIPQWYCDPLKASSTPDRLDLSDIGLDLEVENIFIRLRIIFDQSDTPQLQGASNSMSTNDLLDLACFVLHRLLLLPSPSGIEDGSRTAIMSECIRYATAIYMFITHGPTYYSHAEILNSLVVRLKYFLEDLRPSLGFPDALDIWLISVGMVTSTGTDQSGWFSDEMEVLSAVLGLHCWEDVKFHLQSVLCLDAMCDELFRQPWEKAFASDP